MRLNYTEDEDYPGQLALWQGNRDRSMRGRKGQAALRRLRKALMDMPEKRLIREAISEIDESRGVVDVCALGAVAMMEGHDTVLHSDTNPEDAGVEMGFLRLVSWSIVAQNDIHLQGEWRKFEGPEIYGYYTPSRRVEHTPESRYEKMLAWVNDHIEDEK